MNKAIIRGFYKRAMQHKIDPDVIAEIIRKYFGVNIAKQPNPVSTATHLVQEGGVNDTNNIV